MFFFTKLVAKREIEVLFRAILEQFKNFKVLKQTFRITKKRSQIQKLTTYLKVKRQILNFHLRKRTL